VDGQTASDTTCWTSPAQEAKRTQPGLGPPGAPRLEASVPPRLVLEGREGGDGNTSGKILAPRSGTPGLTEKGVGMGGGGRAAWPWPHLAVASL
jgi:hypothetical protein